MNLKDLQKEIEPQWRVQSYSKNKPSAQCVAYIDARDVMKILDEVVGAENWQDDYKDLGGQIFAGIGIRTTVQEKPTDKPDVWVWKWDTGSESNIEKEKGQASDSFKRAAVKWGIGRFLYDMEIQYVKADAAKTKDNFPNVIDEQGKKIWNLTEHINKILKK